MTRSAALTALLLSMGLLSEIAEITLNNLSGSPQDVEQLIAQKADEHGASYYRILRMEEQAHQPGWRASAILYL